MMTRIGSLLLLLGLASGLIWAARQSSGPVDATWARTHDKTLRQLLRLRPDVRLDFKAARRDPQEPEYYLAQFDAVQGIRRYPLAFYVSRDGKRVVMDEGEFRREYDLADPYRTFREQIQLEGAPALGPAEAPLTVVEYLDYTCGYCHAFFENVEKPMLERYGSKVRLVIKHYPILSEASGLAAHAAVCAQRQSEEKFWALHTKFFEENAQVKQGRVGILALGGKVGLNEAALNRCMEEPATHDAVARDFDEARRLGLEATPGFFINGRPIGGYLPPERFFIVLDEQLQDAQSR
jgi:predicted DsbA family dithiol-disulfide isomerase